MIWTCGRAALRAVAGCALVLGGATGSFGQIVITEIMYDPSAVNDSVGEWFEIYNTTNAAVDINGWTIEEADGSPSHTINNGGPLNVPANSYVVLARNDDASVNGGVTAVYEYGSWALSNSADSIVLKNGGTVVDTVEYDETPFPIAVGASIALAGAEEDLDTVDNNVAANWCLSTTEFGAGDRGTPGAANDCPAPEPPPPPFTGEIFAIQGPDRDSPHVNAMATTNDNIVTAVGADGFFMQTPTARSDNDVNTSDGIFVVHSGAPTVSVGDQVDVVGKVLDGQGESTERSTWYFTRIDATVTNGSVTVDASNQPLPAPVEFDASRPSPNPASRSCTWEYECHEGMRVRIASGTVASGSQHFSTDPVAEMYVTATSSRPFREPGIEYPGESGLPVWDGNPEVFELDPDRLGLANVSWDPGTSFTAVGVLAYEWFGYELWPTELTLGTAGPSLPRAVRAKRSGEITVASQNLLDLREGADATKLGKLSRFIREVLGSPDIVAVQEVYGQTALTNLASRITADDSGVTYTAHVEAPGSSDQSVGFLVRSGVTVNSVTEHGRSETFIDPRDDSVDPLNDRPPLVLDATVGGLDFSVVVIHNRSLSDIDDPARGGWIRTKRLEQAQSVARLVESLQDSRVIVVGDYNAFEFTDGHVDVVGQISGKVTPGMNLLSGPDLVTRDLCVLTNQVPASDRYSFVFQGNAQTLDHAAVNQNLERHVVEIQYARGNADAAENNEDDATNALLASDHDGFVVYLSSDAKPPVNPSPCQADQALPEPSMADLSIDIESEVVSESVVRFDVSVENGGPDAARNVVVGNFFAGGIRLVEVTTSGCREDPDGVPDCLLGSIAAGESASFTIDVDTGGAAEVSLRYTGTAASDTPDPRPADNERVVRQPLGTPNAPSGLTATAIGSMEIELRWRDNSRVETEFAIYFQGPGDPKLRLFGSVPADTTSMVVDDLVPDVTYDFAVEARNGPLRSGRTPKATATTWLSDATRTPKAPSDLTATAIGSTEIELRWRDNSRVETEFAIYFQGPGDPKLRLLGSVPADTTSTVVDDLVPDVTYGFAVEARNGRLRSERTPKATATTWFSGATRCNEDDVLCLRNFEVEVEWTTPAGATGRGVAEKLTAESGDFWFFDPGNIELVVKVLDGCSINGHYWVFAAGLTDVEVKTTVRDLGSGIERSWTNPQGTRFEPIRETQAFATCGAASAAGAAGRVRLSAVPAGRAAELHESSLTDADRAAAASSACEASDTSLCLQRSRFEVRSDWLIEGDDYDAVTAGLGTAIPRTADTGMFWFFSPDNVELVVKVLDGCRLNGHLWVLIGGLTDVGVNLVVTDSESGEARTYRSPDGSPFASVFDTAAFACSGEALVK